MGAWKYVGYGVGGALAGVGAIVLSPVFGAVGVVTAVGAVVGVAVGGATGSAAAYMDDDDERSEQAYKRGDTAGANRTKAELAGESESLKKRLEAISKYLDAHSSHTDLSMAAYGVAVSHMANVGKLTKENVQQTREFVFGAFERNLATVIADEIETMNAKPPSMRVAFTQLKRFTDEAQNIKKTMCDLVDSFEANGTEARTPSGAHRRAA